MSLQKEQLRPPITEFYETLELTMRIQLWHSEKASFKDLLKVNDKSYSTFKFLVFVPINFYFWVQAW